MGNRRFALAATSDDDDDAPPPSSRSLRSAEERSGGQRKRKNVQLQLNDDEEEGGEEERREEKKSRKRKDESDDDGDEEEEEEEAVQDAQPVGDVVRVSSKGRGRRSHYAAFEYDGLHYDLEDSVLLTPEERNQKPYVAIIKDITQAKDGTMMVTGQWFYRPEEAEKKGGGNWQSSDTRELFYSFHRDEVPAESVMHKCVVHFIPLNKQIPKRKQHPGFIVQKVYDTEQRRLFKLTDKDYEDNKQHEIDLLVQKTFSRLGDVPDIETEDGTGDQEDQMRNKRLLRRKNMLPLDVSREDEETARSGQHQKAETPGSCTNIASEYHDILDKFKALTGETQRDRSLERLLQAVQFVCPPVENRPGDDNVKGGSDGTDLQSSKVAIGTQEQSQNGRSSFLWSDVVSAVAALEKASHEAFSSDFQKYNQKMRQLVFNLKNNGVLARRLLKGELEPSKILSMTPNELKEGITAEERSSKEPEEFPHMQMTDARCKRCMEKRVGVRDIIQAGLNARYQLECTGCGNTWYASRDEASTLTIDGPSSTTTVGTAPLATAKFEDVEKQLASPREAEKDPNDVLKKTTEPYMPVLDNQKTSSKPRTEENTTATTSA